MTHAKPTTKIQNLASSSFFDLTQDDAPAAEKRQVEHHPVVIADGSGMSKHANATIQTTRVTDPITNPTSGNILVVGLEDSGDDEKPMDEPLITTKVPLERSLSVSDDMPWISVNSFGGSGSTEDSLSLSESSGMSDFDEEDYEDHQIRDSKHSNTSDFSNNAVDYLTGPFQNEKPATAHQLQKVLQSVDKTLITLNEMRGKRSAPVESNVINVGRPSSPSEVALMKPSTRGPTKE